MTEVLSLEHLNWGEGKIGLLLIRNNTKSVVILGLKVVILGRPLIRIFRTLQEGDAGAWELGGVKKKKVEYRYTVPGTVCEYRVRRISSVQYTADGRRTLCFTNRES